jgi:hypothetical protein
MSALDDLERTLLHIRNIGRESTLEAGIAELNTTLVALLSRMEAAPAPAGGEDRGAHYAERMDACIAAFSEQMRALAEAVRAMPAPQVNVPQMAAPAVHMPAAEQWRNRVVTPVHGRDGKLQHFIVSLAAQ